MKIIQITDSYPSIKKPNDGIFIHQQNLIMKTKYNIDYIVVCPTPYTFFMFFKKYKRVPNVEKVNGITVYNLRYFRVPSNYGRYLSTIIAFKFLEKKLKKIIRNNAVELIHSHWVTPNGYIGHHISLQEKLPHVCSLRGSDINTYPRHSKHLFNITKNILENIDYVISVSEETLNNAKHIAKKIDKSKVVYNGTNIQKFYYKEISKSKVPTFLFIGRLIKEKGVWELMNACLGLENRAIEFKLILIGDGNQNHKIVSFIKDNKLTRRVEIIHRVDYNNLIDYYNRADVFVLPSYSEGLPNVLVEAMACQLPVIATNVGGVGELLRDYDGLIIPKSAFDLEQAMNEMILRRNDWTNIGLRLRSIVVDMFDMSKNVEDIHMIYREVIEDNKHEQL